MINKLIELGFLKLSNWELIDGQLDCDFFDYSNEKNLLYAYVINSQVMYIGQTVMELKRRLYGYKKPGPSQSTNIRVNDLIKSTILDGHRVEIYVFINDESVKYKGYVVNLAAGLENVLIELLSPKWNIQSKKKSAKLIKKVKLPSQSNPLQKHKKDIDLDNSFCEITLYKSYYRKSFFNIPKSHTHYLSMQSRSLVEVTLEGDKSEKLIAVNDRNATSNKSPRIRIGKEFAEWTQSNFQLKDKMIVEFVSKNQIKLTKSV